MILCKANRNAWTWHGTSQCDAPPGVYMPAMSVFLYEYLVEAWQTVIKDLNHFLNVMGFSCPSVGCSRPQSLEWKGD